MWRFGVAPVRALGPADSEPGELTWAEEQKDSLVSTSLVSFIYRRPDSMLPPLVSLAPTETSHVLPDTITLLFESPQAVTDALTRPLRQSLLERAPTTYDDVIDRAIAIISSWDINEKVVLSL